MTNIKDHKIAGRIKVSEPVLGLKLYTLKTGVKDVVSLKGIMLGGTKYKTGDKWSVPSLVVSLLGTGNKKMGKENRNAILESNGISLSYDNNIEHVCFYISALKDKMARGIDFLATDMREPVFKDEEFKLEKEKRLGRIEEGREDTHDQSFDNFTRKIFPKNHVAYIDKEDERIRSLKSRRIDEIKDFYHYNYGLGNMVVVAVGDVSHSHLDEQLRKGFSGWQRSPLTHIEYNTDEIVDSKELDYITIRDKKSVDMVMGGKFTIDVKSREYEALSVGVGILGGGFSSRLINEIREKRGLTYSIGAGTGGIRYGDDGFWYTSGTFAPSLLQNGMNLTKNIISEWAEKGVTREELEIEKKAEIGRYKVGLSTSNKIANRILGFIECGLPLPYIDEYPSAIASLTRREVNDAIKKYIDPKKMKIVAAGSIDKSGKPTI